MAERDDDKKFKNAPTSPVYTISRKDSQTMSELFESMPETSLDIGGLRRDFYSEPVPTRSWHTFTNLLEDDPNDHHKTGTFMHTWHPLGLDLRSHHDRQKSHKKHAHHHHLHKPSEPDLLEEDDLNLMNVEININPDNNDSILNDIKHDNNIILRDNLNICTNFLPSSTVNESNFEFAAQPNIESTADFCTESPEKESLIELFVESPVNQSLQISAPVIESLPQKIYTPKVSFIVGGDDAEDSSPRINFPSKMQSYKNRKHAGYELARRRVHGSDVGPTSNFSLGQIEKDELQYLEGVHIDDLASHRFANSEATRHRKLYRNQKIVEKPIDAITKDVYKPSSEQRTMFVEMHELTIGDEWREKARWIKFEEDVEEDAHRWGKPHVSHLSFHSLIELRRCLEKGSILLNLEAENIFEIAIAIVDELIKNDELPLEQRTLMLDSLLLKHSHMHNSQALLKKNTNPSNIFQNSTNESPRNQSALMEQLARFTSNKLTSFPYSVNDLEKSQNVKIIDEKKGMLENSSEPKFCERDGQMEIFSYPKAVLDILKRIPIGSETSNVLIGLNKFLYKPVSAFVRLKNSTILHELNEVPLPVRFIFILMGPESTSYDYHQVGRSLSTLLADQRFCNAAYESSSRYDLLQSLNEFLDNSIVLPPGDWDEQTLLPIANIRRNTQYAPDSKQNIEKEFLKKSEGIPKKDDPLKRSGKFFGGLVRDVKRRYPLYLSDIYDGFNLQCISAFIFVYFACLSPAITFGGLLSEKTQKLMGVNEMLLATSVCGFCFAVFSGQPLIIIGATGPALVFEEALYKICQMYSIEFLTFRFWVGLWLGIICCLVVMMEGSHLVKYITRFTEEIFALLISLIFIYEVVKKIYYTFKKNPLLEYYEPIPKLNLTTCNNKNMNNNIENISTFLPDMDESIDSSLTTSLSHNNSPNLVDMLEGLTSVFNESLSNNEMENGCDNIKNIARPNTALMSLILMFATFLIALFLKNFRNSHFLGRNARRSIGDFGVPISIVTVAFISFFIKNIYIEKLEIPSGFSPTSPQKRGWLINPIGRDGTFPFWLIFVACVPSLLIFILLFIESVITSMIVNKKDRKLVKGSGYHLDLMITGILSIICATFGLPFMCSATVRSVTHLSALSVYSRTHAPGEKPKLIKVHEQRISAVAVHILIGLSLLMQVVLRQIPLPVLFGVFLYMGIASMSGIQLVNRIKLIFMPTKHHPDVGYVQKVRQFKMNLFTIIQLCCLTVMWIVKSTSAALAFPFVVILLIPFRLFILKLIFTPLELRELDKDEEHAGEDADEMEPDFYTQAHMPI